jgi:hypothetical protein
LGFSTIRALTCAAKGRGFTKYFTLHTFISDLCKNEPGGVGTSTWVIGCRRYFSRYADKTIVDKIFRRELDSTDVYKLVVEHEHALYVAKDKTLSYQRYAACSYERTMSYIKESAAFLSDSYKIHLVGKARIAYGWFLS